MSDQYDDIQEWATLGGGEGDPAASSADIQGYIGGVLSDLGNIHADVSTVPVTSSERANGVFFDVNDLIRYLDGGALVYRDGDGNFIPNPIVHIVKSVDEFSDNELYTVWIDDES
jgi:hypothetical protein